MSHPSPPSSTHTRALGAVGLLLALGGSPAANGQQPGIEAAPAFKGRTVAGVMSYRGAPWLERQEREAEENSAALLEKMDLKRGQTVADLGCGSGFYSRRMARLVGDEGTVFAVDIQPEMLGILRQLSEREGIENIAPILAKEDDPHLPPGEIDWILLVDVYHELQRPAPVLAKLSEALAPNGRIALVEFRLDGDSAAHIKLDHRMSPQQVLKEWEPAGFELVELWEELPTQHLFIFKKRP